MMMIMIENKGFIIFYFILINIVLYLLAISHWQKTRIRNSKRQPKKTKAVKIKKKNRDIHTSTDYVAINAARTNSGHGNVCPKECVAR